MLEEHKDKWGNTTFPQIRRWQKESEPVCAWNNKKRLIYGYFS